MAELPEIKRGVTGIGWLLLRHRLLNGGDGVMLTVTSDGVVRTAHGFSPSDVQAAVALHGGAACAGRFVKTDVKRRITRVELTGRSLIVKEYRRLHRLLCFSPDTKGWLGSQRLPFAARCLGWYRLADSSCAWLVFEDVGDSDLYNPVLDSPEAVECTRLRVIHAARLLAAMHGQGIFHADTKPGNFVAHGQEPSVTLIDCDDVRIYSRLGFSRRLKNVAQFIGCLWKIEDAAVRRTMIQAFLSAYAENSGTTLETLSLQGRNVLMRHIRKLYPERLSCVEGMF